ncbi:APC family permease [Occallatibacter savannae]|uniref:APC family permease n=1 Tax=Occallatibacter savannae TaxID=1002691 RepID=UPI000D6975A6|nr:APC family permease [Occallatibacter savannae]
MAANPALKRGIRFRDLALFYVVVALNVRWTSTAAAAGPSILVIWLAALFCFFIPLSASVMELSSRHPEEGGIYIWTRRAFGDFTAFIAAWMYWMSNLPFFASVLYFGAASVLIPFGSRADRLSSSPLYFMAFAAFWLTVTVVLNVRGVDSGKWLNNICSIGSLVPLTLLIMMAVVSWHKFGSATQFTAASLTPHLSFDNAVFWSGVFFAFGGVEAGSAMGDEIQNPRKTIPWAILVGGIVVTAGYIGGTAALLVALPSESVSGLQGFVNGVHALSDRLGLGWVLVPTALLVGVNTVGSTAANLSSTSRLPFVAGIDHYLPPVFGSIHPRYRTPWVAIAVYGAASIFVAILGQAGTTVRGAYDVLVSMAVVCYFIPYLLLFASMIKLQREPAGPNIRRVPGKKPVAIALALIGFTATSATIVLSLFPGADQPNKALAVAKVIGATLIQLGLGIAIFTAERRRSRRSAAVV